MKKKQLTQKDVNDYMNKNFVKSRSQHWRLISIEFGTYLIIHQAVTIIAFELKSNFEFDNKEATEMIKIGLKQLKYASKEQLTKLNDMYSHWQFFRAYIKFKEECSVNKMHSMFKAAFPFENKSLKNFYTKLNHWTAENSYNLNIKGSLFNKILIVSK